MPPEPGAPVSTGRSSAPVSGDLTIVRHSYDAFEGTPLHGLLRARGVESVVGTGVVTNLCVQTTVQHAFALGYYVVVAEDATAAADPTVQAVTLNNGRAALGYAGRWSQLGRVEEDVAGLLQEALGALGARGLAAARAAARPARARALLRGRPRARGSRCPRRPSRSRAGSATRARSPPASTPATTRCGGRRRCRSGSRSPPSCAGSPRQVGDPELELEGAGWTVVDLLELGDVAGADIQIAAASRLAAALHRPLYEWWTSLFRCARAQLDGRFDEAERLAAARRLAIGQRSHKRRTRTQSLRPVNVQHS